MRISGKLKKIGKALIGKNKFKPTNADKIRKLDRKIAVGVASPAYVLGLGTGVYLSKKAKNNTTPSKPVKKKTAKTATKKYKF